MGPYIEARVIALAAGLVLLNSWANRHTGFELPSLNVGGSILGLVGVFAPHIGKHFEKWLGDTKSEFFRRLLAFGLNWHLLALLWLTLAISTVSWSSVTVTGDFEHDEVKVELVDAGGELLDTETFKRGDSSARLGCRIDPLGRSATIRVEGFLAHPVRVSPWTGATIRLDRDVRIAPTLLVRLPFVEVANRAGGAFRISIETAQFEPSQKEVVKGSTETPAALVMGARSTLPFSLFSRLLVQWNLEADADEHLKKTDRATSILLWQRPEPVSDFGLKPGDRVTVEFYASADQVDEKTKEPDAGAKPKLTATTKLTRAPFQELLLTPWTE